MLRFEPRACRGEPTCFSMFIPDDGKIRTADQVPRRHVDVLVTLRIPGVRTGNRYSILTVTIPITLNINTKKYQQSNKQTVIGLFFYLRMHAFPKRWGECDRVKERSFLVFEQCLDMCMSVKRALPQKTTVKQGPVLTFHLDKATSCLSSLSRRF